MIFFLFVREEEVVREKVRKGRGKVLMMISREEDEGKLRL